MPNLSIKQNTSLGQLRDLAESLGDQDHLRGQYKKPNFYSGKCSVIYSKSKNNDLSSNSTKREEKFEYAKNCVKYVVKQALMSSGMSDSDAASCAESIMARAYSRRHAGMTRSDLMEVVVDVESRVSLREAAQEVVKAARQYQSQHGSQMPLSVALQNPTLAGHIRRLAAADHATEQLEFPEKVKELKANIRSARQHGASDLQLARIRRQAEEIRQGYCPAHKGVNLRDTTRKAILRADINTMSLDDLETFFDEAESQVITKFSGDVWTKMVKGTLIS